MRCRAKYIKEYAETSTVNANLSLEIGQIDGMIDPEQTREVIVESLATLATKRRVKRTTKLPRQPAPLDFEDVNQTRVRKAMTTFFPQSPSHRAPCARSPASPTRGR